MKLSFELKLEIYEKHLAGYSLNYLADEYHLAKTTVRHFCNLADRHGTDILRRSKKKTYSNQFKLNAINRVLIGHESSKSVAVDLGLSCNGMVTTWIKSY
ncbi:transposase, partial [Ruminococcaceae bacterium YAD3003]